MCLHFFVLNIGDCRVIKISLNRELKTMVSLCHSKIDETLNTHMFKNKLGDII